MPNPRGTSATIVMGIGAPQPGQQLHADRDILIVGYAFDTNATVHQGVQGSGIDRVQLFLDIPPNSTPIGDAELGFSDAGAAAYGTQFANSGFD